MDSDQGVISQVRKGMRVVDSAGEDVGSVYTVHMGDPGAVTDQGQDPGESGGIGTVIADIFSGRGELPAQAQARLARVGYLKVDAEGLFSGNRYVARDEIARVTDDTVHLSVPTDRLLG